MSKKTKKQSQKQLKAEIKVLWKQLYPNRPFPKALNKIYHTGKAISSLWFQIVYDAHVNTRPPKYVPDFLLDAHFRSDDLEQLAADPTTRFLEYYNVAEISAKELLRIIRKLEKELTPCGIDGVPNKRILLNEDAEELVLVEEREPTVDELMEIRGMLSTEVAGQEANRSYEERKSELARLKDLADEIGMEKVLTLLEAEKGK
jgi:hypothetical protein